MKRLVLLCLCLITCCRLYAQAPTSSPGKLRHVRQNWFIYGGRFKLNKHWGIHTDVQFRMDEDVKIANQTLLRPGLIRYLSPEMNVIIGYAYANTYSRLLKQYFSEHRIWEQFTYSHNSGSVNQTWRCRVEQRFVEILRPNGPGEVVSEGFKYGNRIRLSYRGIYDLTRKKEAKNVLYVLGFEEVFVNVNAPEINRNVFDQNIFLLAVGVNHEKHTRLEVGYINQFLHFYNRPKTMNHILNVAVVQTLDFGPED